MQHEPEHDPTLKAFEAALGNLMPACASFDRDRVLFEAGRHSRRSGWFWPSTAFFSWLSLCGLGLAWWLAAPVVQERIVYVPTPTFNPPLAKGEEGEVVAQQADSFTDQMNYLQLRHDILENKWPPLPVISLDGEDFQPPTTAEVRLTPFIHTESPSLTWPFSWGIRP